MNIEVIKNFNHPKFCPLEATMVDILVYSRLFFSYAHVTMGSPSGSVVKNLPVMQEIQV